MVDTLKLKETFEANGFSNMQASALTHALHDCSKEASQLATRQELNDVRNELKHDIKEVRNELKHDIKEVRNELIEFKKYMEKKIDQIQESVVDKLTSRALLSQIAIATIFVSLMIYFHQNP